MGFSSPFLQKAGRVTAMAILGGFVTLSSLAQDTPPAKPQLPTAPTTGSAPAQQRPVIIQPDTTTRRPVKAEAKEEEPEEYKEKIPFGDRLMFTGNFGLQFGDITLIQAMPTVGYKFTERFIGGPGLIYQYESYRGLGSFHSYGGKVFGRALVYNDFFFHSEYEYIYLPTLEIDLTNNEISEKRVNVSTLLAGGGYRLMITEHSSLDMMLLFDLIDSRYSPYNSPIVRVGFSGGW